MKPYTEQTVDNISVRTFAADTDEMELIWHRDAEDRLVETLEPTDWQFQFDNALPIDMNAPIFITKETIHRVIKGTGDLKIKVTKYL
jgi:hypothetical protein